MSIFIWVGAAVFFALALIGLLSPMLFELYYQHLDRKHR